MLSKSEIGRKSDPLVDDTLEILEPQGIDVDVVL